jgi:hypothetical protein
MTYLPLRGFYHNLSARGSVVSCLAREGLIYISSKVSVRHGYPWVPTIHTGNPSIRTASHFLAP